jgi:V/A-type H+-transporting ATPase subunit I
MIVPAEMSEVDIFVPEGDIQVVTQTIAEMGVVHLLDVHTLGEWAEHVSTEWAGRISAYGNQLRRIRELCQSLGIAEGRGPAGGPLDPAEALAGIEEELQQIEARAHAISNEESTLRHELERWELTARSMEMLAPLSVSIADLRQLQHLHLVAGTLPAENLARLETSLFRIPYSIMPVHQQAGRVLVFAFCALEHAAILDRALESAFLDRLEIPEEYTGNAQEVLGQIGERIAEATSRLQELITLREALVREVAPRLHALYARALDCQSLATAMSGFGQRGRVYLVAGWVPKDQVSRLRAAVESAADGRVTFDENSPYTPGPAHQVPTLLRNPKAMRPLQGLVTTYGIPAYEEMDPTPLLAFSFVLMFGMMFGDLGHGLVLTVVGALAMLRVVPFLAPIANLGGILVACGASSALFGLLYGSVFGVESLVPPLWLHPLEGIFTLLGVSVAFGVVLLNIGFALHIITAIRRRQLRKVIVDRYGLVGVLLYWSLVGSVLLIATGRGEPIWLAAGAVLLAGMLFFSDPLTNLLTGERPLFRGNLGEGLIQAFFELFEALISYVSNTLSYVRLGAFAVAHVGLTTVVLLLADMVSGGGGIHVLARGLVLVLGNLFVIGFEGLIVGIQTLRLEYYELFGKFFTGTGVPFQPLTLPSLDAAHPANRAR